MDDDVRQHPVAPIEYRQRDVLHRQPSHRIEADITRVAVDYYAIIVVVLGFENDFA